MSPHKRQKSLICLHTTHAFSFAAHAALRRRQPTTSRPHCRIELKCQFNFLLSQLVVGFIFAYSNLFGAFMFFCGFLFPPFFSFFDLHFHFIVLPIEMRFHLMFRWVISFLFFLFISFIFVQLFPCHSASMRQWRRRLQRQQQHPLWLPLQIEACSSKCLSIMLYVAAAKKAKYWKIMERKIKISRNMRAGAGSSCEAEKMSTAPINLKNLHKRRAQCATLCCASWCVLVSPVLGYILVAYLCSWVEMKWCCWIATCAAPQVGVRSEGRWQPQKLKYFPFYLFSMRSAQAPAIQIEAFRTVFFFLLLYFPRSCVFTRILLARTRQRTNLVAAFRVAQKLKWPQWQWLVIASRLPDLLTN